MERYGALEENHRERKRIRTYSGYVALLCDFIDKEPSTYEEETERKEWKDAMIEEYQEDQEIEDPQEPVDPAQENNPPKRKPSWV